MRNDIFVKNAKENNLKGIDVSVPRNKLVVFSGISGSGKSSLAFDTIFAEGQRRYVESLSAYARQFLGQMDKPNVESIEGLSPAISIDQKTTSSNPRSTVGTVTEIYDYLRLLFSRVGTPFCHSCGKEITKQSIDQICDKVLQLPLGSKLSILSPVVRGRKGEYSKQLDSYKKSGFVRAKIDGQVVLLEDETKLDKNQKHSISVIVDRLSLKEDSHQRLSDSVQTALKLSDGLVVVECDGEEKLYSDKFTCTECGISVEDFEPRAFSFNSPFGACEVCHGLGFSREFDENLIVPDRSKSLEEGAISVVGINISSSSMMEMYFKAIAKKYRFKMSTPVKDLSKEAYELIMFGNGGEKIEMDYTSKTFVGSFQKQWEGVVPMLSRRYNESTSDWVRSEYENYMKIKQCPSCHGMRLKKEILAVKIADKNIFELCQLSIDKLYEFFDKLQLDSEKTMIAHQILKEAKARLKFLLDVGLDYLSLSRSTGSLSGGEAQRIRLATQIGSGLTGVLYILDEPSIGLHQKDNAKLIETLKKLRELGNTLIVVEHDEETLLAADHVIDIGPGAGIHGGYLIYSGNVDGLLQCDESVTGQYLSHKKQIETPKSRREEKEKFLSVCGATQNNLKNINASFPIGVLTAVTGVSGSGKSSLVNETLLPFLVEKLNNGKKSDIQCKSVSGTQWVDKVIAIDQSAIGRTPRSNPATYTGLFTHIRELFASTLDSKERGFSAGRFSFNVKGGRCDNCDGDGVKKIEMNFLPDVYVPCEVCKTKRYNRETLAVKYKGKNISDVLNMTIEEALSFFENLTSIKNKLQTLFDVGLGYITLGQSATTLSGGEAQRVKLATELAKRSTGKTVYILDEPTTGLHSADVDKLVTILQRLVSTGNTVIVIEHNLDIIRVADFVIDMGPNGGDRGGEVVACGTPEQVSEINASFTGQYLKKVL